MELKKLTEKTYYIHSSVNIGVIKYDENSVVLIDSGLDDDAGKKILKLLNEKGLAVKAIINTHSHADHCGGNRFIKRNNSVKIYAPEVEASIIQNTILEPLYLFSGANPPTELRNKFLMAEPCDVDYLIKKEDNNLKFGEIELNVILLPGHSPNQIGISVDGVLFCADSVFSEETINKHKIPFHMDVGRAKETLLFLRDSKYRLYVPSHAEPRESLAELVAINLEAIDGIEKTILSIFQTEKTTETCLRELCSSYQIEIKGTMQYYLMNTIVMAYLSYLAEKKMLKGEAKNNAMFWIAIVEY